MPGKLNISYADYGGENSSFSANIPTIAAGTLVAVSADIASLVTAIAGVTQGLQVKEQVVLSETGSGSGKASAPAAQRENKWLVSYRDTTTLKLYTLEIPCALLTANTLDQNSKNGAKLTDALWVAFITAFEAVVRSPTSGAVTVENVRFVGRNI